MIREALRPYAAELAPWLWEVVENKKSAPAERLRAACALAVYAPEHARWQEVSGDVAARLVAEQVLDIARWAEALRPARGHLLSSLAALIADENRDAGSRRLIIRLYTDYAQGLPEPYTPLDKEVVGLTGPFIDNDARVAQATAPGQCGGGTGRAGPLGSSSPFTGRLAEPVRAVMRSTTWPQPEPTRPESRLF